MSAANGDYLTAYAVPDNEGDDVYMVATKAGYGGDIVELPDGRYGVVAGLKPFALGDTIAVVVEAGRTFRVLKLKTDDVAAGDKLYWDPVNGYLTKTAGALVKLFLAVNAAGTTATRVKAALLIQTPLSGL